MNTDHPDDSVLIVRALGGQPAATEARLIGLTETGIEFAVVAGGEPTQAQVPWAAPPTERAHIRAEVVRMYVEACAVLGIAPRQEAEH